MSTNSATNRPVGESPGERGLPARRPVTVFLLLALAIGLPVLAIPVVLGLPTEPFLLVLVFVALLGSALLVTRLADGAGAVRHLLSRVLIWRFGVGRWAVVLFGVPVLTMAVAAASGTLSTPEKGWLIEVGWYLFNTLIFGALILNLWEEMAWAGFAQSRLMARHGLVVASLITAVFFAVIHLPLYLEGDPTRSEVAIGLAILFAMAPVYRYLIGMHLLDTGGSILAVGVQHASWNAALNLDAVDGGDWEWQVPVAVVLLTAMVASGRRFRPPSDRPIGREAEKSAAAEWIHPKPR
ncbi:CPBP family intramembrane glutamic endopeptidase [Aeromicrobium sp.]|uniref:CPBP family intramembrane glutamic endopeptidase n=1 Tax=Aeromicrobium sp. TaxID=1871063 RepID=UPI003D6B1773